jgi:hypothetical protein
MAGSKSSPKTKKAVLGWWFAAAQPDGSVILPHGDGRLVVPGETLTVKPPIEACVRGLHASTRALDALGYARGPMVARVQLSGILDKSEADKVAASRRKTLWLVDATRALHEFAVWCARQALEAERAAGREPDARSWRALEVRLAWLRGEASDADLSAAESAAWSAAWSAESAAWSAARGAARGAARSAARSAARGAAWSAAGSAAWSAAGSAAGSAAWSAAGSAQNDQLEKMLQDLAPKSPQETL